MTTQEETTCGLHDNSTPSTTMDDNSSRGDPPSISNGTLPRAKSEEATLTCLHDFLKSKEFTEPWLDEDKVMVLTHAIHRETTDRTRLRKNLVEDFEVLKDRDRVYDRIYLEEASGATACRLFHDTIDLASSKAATRMNSRTLNWLRRATGVQRSNDLLEQQNQEYCSDIDDGETEGLERRMTRGVKKERQKQRMLKETEGLSIVVDAIKEIEQERGMSFDLNKQSYNNSSEEDGSISHAPDDYISRRFASGLLVRDYPPKSELIASMRSRHLSVRLLFRGKVVSRASAKELEQWHASSKQRRILERKRSRNENHQPKEEDEDVVMIDSVDSVNIENPPEISKVRLELYAPETDDVIAASVQCVKVKPTESLKPFPHASISTKFFRFLSGRARWWASHEFFYPDLDAAWYDFDPHAGLIISLLPPGVELTWHKWKRIRRQFNRPRRFSQSFIANELTKRNRFRRIVRQLQRSPDSTMAYSFPVPAIFEPGTVVSAYHRKYRIVHQGRVLFYSPGDNGYLIQFDAEELGCEFCPDTEVASMNTSLKQSLSLNKNDSFHRSDGSDESSDIPSLPENDAAYERFSLVSLIATIDQATTRKKAILDAIEENNRFIFPPLRTSGRNGVKYNPERSGAFQRSTMAWLHANLILVNQSLNESMELLRLAYSEESASTQKSRLDAILAQRAPLVDVLDDEQLKGIADQILASDGTMDGSKTLKRCLKGILEMEMRKVLARVPGK